MTDQEMQTNDISASWIDAEVFTKDLGGDRHEIVVVNNGEIADHFTLELANGEEVSREYPHWLQSLKGKNARSAKVKGTYGESRDLRYNLVTGEIKP